MAACQRSELKLDFFSFELDRVVLIKPKSYSGFSNFPLKPIEPCLLIELFSNIQNKH